MHGKKIIIHERKGEGRKKVRDFIAQAQTVKL